MRKNAQGFEYNYSEGGMIFPDPLDKPSRTIITGEGGKSASRFKHVIQTPKGYRRLSPVELERLNMFPDDHTKLEGMYLIPKELFLWVMHWLLV
jgi:DNA (cytosine-5)-methyltransferase 1